MGADYELPQALKLRLNKLGYTDEKITEKIADYSGNKLLIKLYEVMTQLTEVYIRRNISTIEYNEKIIDEHEKILKQVEEEDVEVAKLYSLLYVEKVLSKV